VAGGRVVPELIQGECTPERIAGELTTYLDRPAEANRVRETLLDLRSRLGGPGIYERAADAVLEELGRTRPV
jgi:lipid-A-disaccharide synthase